jgi:hypothetical protein
MSRARIIGDSLPPPTERVPTIDGAKHLCPTFWRVEMKLERRELKKDPTLVLLNTPFPRIAALAARDAALWLQAIGAVVPR